MIVSGATATQMFTLLDICMQLKYTHCHVLYMCMLLFNQHLFLIFFFMNMYICRLLQSSRKHSSWPSSSRVEPHRSRQPLARHRLQLLLRLKLRSLRLQPWLELPLCPTQQFWWELSHTQLTGLLHAVQAHGNFFVQWSCVKSRVQLEIVKSYQGLSVRKSKILLGLGPYGQSSSLDKASVWQSTCSSEGWRAVATTSSTQEQWMYLVSTLESFRIRGITRCGGLAVFNSIQTCCVTGIHLLQSPQDLCVFHI